MNKLFVGIFIALYFGLGLVVGGMITAISEYAWALAVGGIIVVVAGGVYASYSVRKLITENKVSKKGGKSDAQEEVLLQEGEGQEEQGSVQDAEKMKYSVLSPSIRRHKRRNL